MNTFLAIVFASVLSRLGYQMARSPVLPRFAEDLGATPEFIGVIVAASTITGVFFKLPAGALSDVIGKKRMMVLGGLFFAVPPFFYPLIEEGVLLLILRFIHGFATAVFSPVAAAYVANLAEDRRGARLGWFSSGNDLGATAGPLLGGIVLYYTASYTMTYLLVGALGVLTLALVLLVPERASDNAGKHLSLADRAADFWLGLRAIAAIPAIFVAAGVEAVMYLGFGAFLGFLPIYAKAMHLNDAEIAVALGAQLAIAMAVKPIAGQASDHVGRKPVIVVGLLLCAASLPLIFRADTFVALVTVAPLLGLGVGAVTPVTNALVADLAEERRMGAAMGVFGTIWDVGEAAGPIIAGFLIGHLAYAPAFDVIATVTVAAAAGFALFVKDPRTRASTQA